jgi:hypothetical protein
MVTNSRQPWKSKAEEEKLRRKRTACNCRDREANKRRGVNMRTPPSYARFLPAFLAVTAWFHNRTDAAGAETDQTTPRDVEPAPRTCAAAGVDPADSARQIGGVALLFRCMPMLQIDPDELAMDDPLLFRELQGLCSLCGCKTECTDDLARQFDEVSLEKWRQYCPNAATLTMLAAVQNCALAAQHMKRPRTCGVVAP